MIDLYCETHTMLLYGADVREHLTATRCNVRRVDLCNETAYDTTDNLADFWAAGGTWSMDRYISELRKRGDL